MSKASLNEVKLIGNLGKDPDVRYTPNETQVTNITIATSKSWKDKQSGEQREKTEWHRVVFFGKLAEIAGTYLKKGSQVYICGELQTRKWQDKQSGQDRYTTEIVANDMLMLGGRPNNDGGQGNQGGYQGGYQGNQGGTQYQGQGQPAQTPAMAGAGGGAVAGAGGGWDGEGGDIPFAHLGRGALY